jgi:mannose-1-phosphate guanylyltransferase
LRASVPIPWKKIWASPESALPAIYESLKPEPIDIAIMEKAETVRVVPAEMGWSDIGSWDALYRLLPKDSHQNAQLAVRVFLFKPKAA